MIARLRGRIEECRPGMAVLDVSGVGYAVHIPLSTYYVISTDDAADASLYVHTHVREDALQLFGFASEDERWIFEQCISISGVGPKLALSILSGIGVDDLREAVRAEDKTRLQRIPGVGRKTAERLMLELRDRLFDAQGNPVGSSAGPMPTPAAPPKKDAVRDDAASALVNLGYAQAAAEKAVDRVIDESGAGSLQEVLRAALSGLVR